MNPAQARTARGCALIAFLLFCVGLVALWVEIAGAAAHSYATISDLSWLLWAHQPWVMFLVTHLVAAPVWFLLGHFTAQSNSVYDRIRQEGHP